MQSRLNRSGALATLMLALALSGCVNADVFDSSEHWFSRPFDLTGRKGGYTFSELQELSRNRPITANDVVDANGACPPLPAPAPAPSASAAVSPGASSPSPEAPSLLGEGIALGMSECDVVYRAGAPGAVQLGKNPNGDRTLVLTYNSGPRPGIYRFERGRLMDMDRVDVPPPPAPKVAKKKKKPAKPRQVSTE